MSDTNVFIPKRTTTPTTTPATKQNNGGFGGGLEYLGRSLGAGIVGIGEGIYDYIVGGIAKAAGNDKYAQHLMDNDIAGRMQQKATDKFNPNGAWEFAGQVASGIGQSTVGALVAAGAVALAPVTGGSSLAIGGIAAGTTIGIGAAGQSTAQAYQKTGELGGKEFGYGAASGLLEGGLEGLTGAAGRVGSKVAKQTARSAAKKVVRKSLAKDVLTDAAGEFVEESLSEFLNPYLERGLDIDKNAENATTQQILYAGLVGAVSGALMSGTTNALVSTKNTEAGAKAIKEGKVDEIIKSATDISKFVNEAENSKLIAPAFRDMAASLNKYNQATDKTSPLAKMYLGEVKRGLAKIQTATIVQKSYESVIADADNVAKWYNEQGQNITADQIRNDENGLAMRIAVSDVVAKMIMPDTTTRAMDKFIGTAEKELAKKGVISDETNADLVDAYRQMERLNAEGSGLKIKEEEYRFAPDYKVTTDDLKGMRDASDFMKTKGLLAQNFNSESDRRLQNSRIKAAISAGKTTVAEIKAIQKITNRMGVKLRFDNIENENGVAFDGSYENGTISIDVRKADVFSRVAMHEYIHHLAAKAKAEFARVREAIKAVCADNEQLQKVYDKAIADYKKATPNKDAAYYEEEAICRVVEQFISEFSKGEKSKVDLANVDREHVVTLRDFFRRLKERIKGYAVKKSNDDMTNVIKVLDEILNKKVVDKAEKRVNNKDTERKLSLTPTTININGKEIEIVDKSLVPLYTKIINSGYTYLPTLDEIYAIPAVIEAEKRLISVAPTFGDNTSERIALRNKVKRQYLDDVKSAAPVVINGKTKAQYSGKVAKDKIAVIITGRAASGKSNLVNAYSYKHEGRVLDNDIVKERLPEFNKGIGANAVHEESSRILDDIIHDEILNSKSEHYGENSILVIVGKKAKTISRYAQEFYGQNYKVFLVNNELSVAKCLQRGFTRFCETGRYVNFRYISSLVSTSESGNQSPLEHYNELKKENYIYGYANYTNDVGKGEYPKCLENSKGVELEQEHFALTGRGRGQGSSGGSSIEMLQGRGSERSATLGSGNTEAGNARLTSDRADDTSRRSLASDNPDIRYSAAGQSSQTMDFDMRDKAIDMMIDGKSAQEIWEETGFFMGKDGNMRYEIDDSKSKISNKTIDFTEKSVEKLFEGKEMNEHSTLDKLLVHKGLYDAYPILRKVDVYFEREYDETYYANTYISRKEGSYGSASIGVQKEAFYRGGVFSVNKFKSSLIHEVQHIIQVIEGFSEGTNAQAWKEKLRKEAIKEFNENPQAASLVADTAEDYANIMVDDYIAFREYWNTYGEQEARNSQERMDMTPEQRAKEMPFAGNGESVFAEDWRNEDKRYSISTAEAESKALLTMPTNDKSSKIKGVIEDAKDTKISFMNTWVNAQAGIEKYCKKLGISNIEATTNFARSSSAAANHMIEKELRPVFEAVRKGRKSDTAYASNFMAYLLHWHNTDRMAAGLGALSEEGEAWVNDKVKEYRRGLLADANIVLKERVAEYKQKHKDEGKKINKITLGKFVQREKTKLKDEILPKVDLYRKQQTELCPYTKGKPVFGKTVSADDSKLEIAEYDRIHPEFKAMAEKVWAYSAKLLKMQLDGGLISQDHYDTLTARYPHYVPTYRDTEGAQTVAAVKGKGFVEINRGIKTAKGSDLDILPIDVMLARRTMQVFKAVRMNDVVRSLRDAGAADKNAARVVEVKRAKVEDNMTDDVNYDAWRPKDNQVTFFDNGEAVTLAVSKDIFTGIDAYSSNPNSEWNNPVMNFTTKWNSVFKKLVTAYNPFFTFRNMLRDLQEAGLYTKSGWAKFLKNFGLAYQQIAFKGKYWNEYLEAGGLNSSVFDYDKGYKRSPNGLKRALEAIETVNIVIEQAPRLAEFISSREGGLGIEQSLLNAADVTVNFGRGGTFAKKLNSSVIPFLNPSIQGFDKLMRTVFGKKTVRAWVRLIVRAALLGIGASLLNDMLLGDDDDYKALRQSDKENNFLIKVGDGKFLKLPKGRVSACISQFYFVGKQVASKEKVDWKTELDTASSNMSPVESLGRFVWSPFTDVAANRTWYGSDIETASDDNLAPRERYNENTSSIAIALGKAFNYSPKKIHYLLDQYSGVIGDVLLPVTTQAAERGILDKNFTVDSTLQGNSGNEFYSEIEEATYAKNEGNLAAKAKLRYLNRIKSKITDLTAEKKTIQNSDLSDKDKQAQTRTIQVLINNTMNSALINASTFEDELSRFAITEDNYEAVYLQAYRNAFGAEAALEQYDENIYAKGKVLSGIGVKWETYFDAYFTIKAATNDYDKKGNIIEGSRKAKVTKYIKSLKGLTKEQKAILLASAGYTLDTSLKNKVKQSGKKLSEEDRALLYSMCGIAA